VPRFDLYKRRGEPGYLLNVQHDLYDHLPTRVVVPVAPLASGLPPLGELTPRVEIDGEPHLLFPQYLAAVPKRELGRAVANLDPHRDAITKALDLLLTGF
jgi:toxin CcdB